MTCKRCGSYAINHHTNGRDGSRPDRCDVCYWRDVAEERAERIKRLEEAGDAMANLLIWSSGMRYRRSPTASAWRKAKEAKP